MKIKNATANEVLIIGPGSPTNESWLPAGKELVLLPGEEKILLDEDVEKSAGIAALLTSGKLTNMGPQEPTDGTPVNDDTQSGKRFEGTSVFYKNNATSFRLAGKNFLGIDVQSYAGVFYNDQFDSPGLGVKKTRTIIGSNEDMDIEIQGSHAVLISAQDINFHDGFIKMGANRTVDFHCYADGDTIAVKKMQVSRMDEATYGDANTSDVEIRTSDGPLHINDSNGKGIVVGGTCVLDGVTISISGDNVVFTKGAKSATVTMA